MAQVRVSPTRHVPASHAAHAQREVVQAERLEVAPEVEAERVPGPVAEVEVERAAAPVAPIVDLRPALERAELALRRWRALSLCAVVLALAELMVLVLGRHT